METVLVLVCKRPILGIGKQRLAASIGVELAQRVSKALLNCAVEDAYAWPGPVVIAPADPHDVQWARTLSAPIPSPVTVVPQVFGNLGHRLNVLDHTLRHSGMKKLAFIGSDSPGLSLTDYAAVNESLIRHDTVLIPAVDGGVVLMASNVAWPELSGLPWSSNQLGSSLLSCCRAAGHYVAKLQSSYDVDEFEDFIKLEQQLASDQRPARRALHQLACSIISTIQPTNA